MSLLKRNELNVESLMVSCFPFLIPNFYNFQNLGWHVIFLKRFKGFEPLKRFLSSNVTFKIVAPCNHSQ
jgi:hypothetical protein